MIFSSSSVVPLLVFSLTFVRGSKETIEPSRPLPFERTFTSGVIDNLVDTLYPLFDDRELATTFLNCFPNTLDTTVASFSAGTEESSAEDIFPDSFIITGDIEALWLRDSGNQIIPYLPYGPEEEKLQLLFEGLIARHSKSILIDSFANAFNFNASGAGHQNDQRIPPMKPSLFEGKYEIDSLCATIKISYWHWRFSGDSALQRFATDDWMDAMAAVVNTIEVMQTNDGSDIPVYLFQRETQVATDTLMMQGRGPPSRRNGMSRSLFRPSDDAVTMPFNVPGNAMACVELTHLQELINALEKLFQTHHQSNAEDNLQEKLQQLELLHSHAERVGSEICESLAVLLESREELTKIDAAVSAVDTKSRYNKDRQSVIPYEVDGFGGAVYMDDANIPSLLSLPVLGFLSSSNELYKKTRDFVLSSTENPFYFTGPAGEGVGGPHEGYNYAWPMAIVMRAMTSDNDAEIRDCLNMLVRTSAGTGFMHESFNVQNAEDFTRSWFAWANGLLGELVLQLVVERPHLVLKDDEEIVAKAQALVRKPVSLLAQQETLYVR